VGTAGLWIEVQALRKASVAPVAQARPVMQPATATAAREASAPTMAPHASRDQHSAMPGYQPDVERRTQHGGVTHPEEAVSKETSTAAAVMVSSAAEERTGNTSQYGTNQMEHSAGAPSDITSTMAGQNPHEHDEFHKKARRFAKLLIDEIVLYNRAKVEEGRSRRDLYDRLKDDIDKSRATYDRRYAETPIAAHDYFTQALINGLAQQNPELLGPNFVHGGSRTV
jgi:hypothetical protein